MAVVLVDDSIMLSKLGGKVYVLLFNSFVKFHAKISTHCSNINKSPRGYFLCASCRHVLKVILNFMITVILPCQQTNIQNFEHCIMSIVYSDLVMQNSNSTSQPCKLTGKYRTQLLFEVLVVVTAMWTSFRKEFEPCSTLVSRCHHFL